MPTPAIQAIALEQAQAQALQAQQQQQNALLFEGQYGGFHTPAAVTPQQQIAGQQTLDGMTAEQIAQWAQAEAGRVTGPERFIP